MKEKLDAVQKLVNAGKPIKENEDAKAILAEFDNILNAVKDFEKNCANKNLVKN
ncbi:MAG: hypothetical protein ACLTCI_01165 [[Clostridium] nexile]